MNTTARHCWQQSDGNTKRRFERKIGDESDAGRVIRNGLPRPGGYLVVVVVMLGAVVAATIGAGR